MYTRNRTGNRNIYQDRPLNCHRFLPKSSCILRRSRESDAAANWILLISFHLCTIKPTFSITRRKSSPSRFSWLFADSFEIRLGRSSTIGIVGLKFRQKRIEEEKRKFEKKTRRPLPFLSDFSRSYKIVDQQIFLVCCKNWNRIEDIRNQLVVHFDLISNFILINIFDTQEKVQK